MIMKNRQFICAAVLLLCIGCKTQELVSCEDVSKTADMPWLASIVQTGVNPTGGAKLESIDKIVYSLDSTSNTTHVGFFVRYEPKCCDIPGSYIYDCDGKIITTYGGILGCSGECNIKIRSNTNLYTAK